jgi:NADH dehydrogenase
LIVSPRPRVVIVGAGFGGLTLARKLRSVPVDVTLLDRHNYHQFSPLIYQVATALLDPGEVAQPVRKLIRGVRNCDFRLGDVTSIDLDSRRVATSYGELPYEYLVLATGSVSNYFGNRSMQARSFGLKDLADALAIRNRTLARFERSRWVESPEERRQMLTFAVIGGGPTGVEFAGALSELIRLVFRKDFHGEDLSESRVVLIEGSDRLLGTFDRELGEKARRSLEKKNVEVWLGALVREVRRGEVELSDGRVLEAGTVIWTAGVRAAPTGELLGVPLDRSGRVPVGPALQLDGHPEVYVIGDSAGREDLPMLAQVAMQQARHVARSIHRTLTGRELDPFRYRDPGIMATIGRNSAVAQIGRFRFSGFLGWVLWLFVHLVKIVTFRARLVTLVNWAWDYFFYDRPVRLLVRANPDTKED